MYHVVFEYTSRAGLGSGARYRVSFSSEQAFKEAEGNIPEDEKVTKVVAEGVSDDEALRLCEAASTQSLVGAAIEAATVPGEGVDPFILEQELMVVAFARRATNR